MGTCSMIKQGFAYTKLASRNRSKTTAALCGLQFLDYLDLIFEVPYTTDESLPELTEIGIE